MCNVYKLFTRQNLEGSAAYAASNGDTRRAGQPRFGRQSSAPREEQKHGFSLPTGRRPCRPSPPCGLFTRPRMALPYSRRPSAHPQPLSAKAALPPSAPVTAAAPWASLGCPEPHSSAREANSANEHRIFPQPQPRARKARSLRRRAPQGTAALHHGGR